MTSNYLMTLTCLALMLFSTHSSLRNQQPILIRINASVHKVDERFLSIAIDTNLLRNKWRGFELSERVQTLARALHPAYLRIGGTSADFLVFDDDTELETAGNYVASPMSRRPKRDVVGLLYGKPMKTFSITAQDLDRVHEIASKTGWDVIFDLNVLLRKEDGSWNSSNPLKIMNYVREKGYNFVWQLGNEPNHFGKFHSDLTAEQLGKDFQELRRILDNDPSLGKTLAGPDVDRMTNQKTHDYLKQFLDGGGDVIDAMTWHQYYMDGRTSSIQDFYNATVLDTMFCQLNDVNDIVDTRSPPIKAWMGETSSAWGGGAPGLSDRYVAGFMWLDKLGLAARLKQDIVIRQTFYGGRYGLLYQNLAPTPDYWLSAVYKHLVGSKVLDVEGSLEEGRLLRIYAHCTNSQLSGYNDGAVTVIAINIDPSNNATFRLTEGLRGLVVDQYLLTPSKAELTSQSVLLNGQVLQLIDDKTLPKFNPQQITTDHVIMPPLSMGFYVIPDANAEACEENVCTSTA